MQGKVFSVAAVITLVIGASGPAPDFSAANSNPLLEQPIEVSFGCDLMCDYCETTAKHRTIKGGIRGGRQHGCFDEGSCGDHSPCLALTPEILNGARYAALGRGLNELVRLRSEKPEMVVLNEERRAVQVLDCQGRVAANFPLASDVMQILHGQD